MKLQNCRIKCYKITKLKNRDGAANIMFGMQYIGEIGKFEELPRAKEMTDMDYTLINNIKKI